MKKISKMICDSQVMAVFAEPAATSARVGQLWRGQEVTVCEVGGDWAKIIEPDGWVIVGHLKDAPDEVGEEKKKSS